jgi:hypothetical protein
MGGKNKRKNKSYNPSVGRDYEELFLISMCWNLDMIAPYRGSDSKPAWKQRVRSWVEAAIVENMSSLGHFETDPEIPDTWWAVGLASLAAQKGMTIAKFREGASSMRKLMLAPGSGGSQNGSTVQSDPTTGSYKPNTGENVSWLEDLIPDSKAGPSEQAGDENQWWDPFDWF